MHSIIAPVDASLMNDKMRIIYDLEIEANNRTMEYYQFLCDNLPNDSILQ